MLYQKYATKKRKVLEEEEKNLKKLDKLLDKQEEELFKDKIKFGERVDDVFMPRVLPRGCKNRPTKKNNGLLFLSKDGQEKLEKAESDLKLREKAVNSMQRKKMIADERKKAIDSYREMQSKKMKF